MEGPISGLYINESMNFILFSARSGKVKKLDIVGESLNCSSFEMNHGDCIIDMNVDDKHVLTGGSDAKLILWKFDEGKTQLLFTGQTPILLFCTDTLPDILDML